MKKGIACIVSAILMAGCVPSWNPLYTDKDLVSDPALVGVWTEGKESWVFKKDGEKKYKLMQTDKEGHSAQFAAYLLKLKEQRFLDLYLEKMEEDINAWAGASLIPAHLILRIDDINSTVLKLAVMDPDWLEKHLKQNPKSIRHEKVGEDRIVLTAPTLELQQFVLDHVTGQGLFGEPGEFKRKSETAPPK